MDKKTIDKVFKAFEEIKSQIPLMCSRWGKKGRYGQFLYGDVVDWIRDVHLDIYQNKEACNLFARLIIGEYVITSTIL